MNKVTLRIFGALMALLLAGQASALTIGDSRDLGYIQYGIPSGNADRTAYVNYLIDMTVVGVATYDTVTKQTYTRTNVSCGSPCTDAVFGVNGSTTTIDLGSGYKYLFAKYDGPNYGAEVWYVEGLTGIITIPLYPNSRNQYALSGWTLFNGSGGHDVPEPGTLALFGFGLVGLGLARRRSKA